MNNCRKFKVRKKPNIRTVLQIWNTMNCKKAEQQRKGFSGDRKQLISTKFVIINSNNGKM